eukprot:COSAG06_NODE_2540_length_6706_cov_9.446647_6_plen_98_part_00
MHLHLLRRKTTHAHTHENESRSAHTHTFGPPFLSSGLHPLFTIMYVAFIYNIYIQHLSLNVAYVVSGSVQVQARGCSACVKQKPPLFSWFDKRYYHK